MLSFMLVLFCFNSVSIMGYLAIGISR
jgi:hypothetical protein